MAMSARAKVRLVVLAVFLAAVACAQVPRRIVSLSPNLTELLYGIGAFGQIAGVSDFASYPPQASKLPSVGGWQNPNLEKLVALRPDLVIMDQEQAQFVEQKCKDLGLKVMSARGQSLHDCLLYTSDAADE